jgi:2-C-methyl-D-erythritol 4-phosphate cytidylyltransferase/2-C-methyl-D-erythritol 2,4-cyclodiphosphate synthase
MYQGKEVIALMMAAGNGSRFGQGAPKQFLDVGGEPMVLKSARAFDACGHVDGIWAVAPPDRRTHTDAALGALQKYRGSVAGGGVRQESVRLGLRAVAGDRKRRGAEGGAVVLVHDAARPFVTNDVIERVLSGVAATGAAIACVPVTDTVYVAGGKPAQDGPLYLVDAPDRGLLWSVQTPQGFDLDMILRAHEAAAADGFEATDDGAVARAYGCAAGGAVDGRRGADGCAAGSALGGSRGADVLIAMGDYANRKITVPTDMHPGPGGDARKGDRVGIGFDVHAFSRSADRKLVLGGVTIPHERGLEGHSDADVLTHALMDAMLGALALGDIGFFFPETEERYLGISSMKLLEEVKGMIGRKGYIVYNADTTIVAERPRMAGHVDAMKGSLAAALGVGRDRIGVKATTTEMLGFTGREEGIGAQAIVRLTEGE